MLRFPVFRTHFRPFCPHPAYGSSLRAEGGTHFLAPPTRAWHPRPPGHWSPAPSSTTPGPAGSGRAQTFPRWLLPSTDRGLTEIERGPISTIGLPYYSVCHQTERSLRADQTFPSHTPPPSRRESGHPLSGTKEPWVAPFAIRVAFPVSGFVLESTLAPWPGSRSARKSALRLVERPRLGPQGCSIPY